MGVSIIFNLFVSYQFVLFLLFLGIFTSVNSSPESSSDSSFNSTVNFSINSINVFIYNKFFNFFRNMLNTEAIEINNFIFLQNKEIQCAPVSAYSSRFITYAPSLIFSGKLSLEKTPLNLDSFS